MSHKKHLIALTALLFARAAFAETVNYNVFVKLDNTAESRVNDISQALAKQGVKSLFAQGLSSAPHPLSHRIRQQKAA